MEGDAIGTQRLSMGLVTPSRPVYLEPGGSDRPGWHVGVPPPQWRTDALEIVVGRFQSGLNPILDSRMGIFGRGLLAAPAMPGRPRSTREVRPGRI